MWLADIEKRCTIFAPFNFSTPVVKNIALYGHVFELNVTTRTGRFSQSELSFHSKSALISNITTLSLFVDWIEFCWILETKRLLFVAVIYGKLLNDFLCVKYLMKYQLVFISLCRRSLYTSSHSDIVYRLSSKWINGFTPYLYPFLFGKFSPIF